MKQALWLCMRFHRLALEVFPPDEGPAVAVSQQRIGCANDAAEAHGIQPGMRLASALGLAPGLAVHECDAAREIDTLHQLACWAGGFSPHVSVAGTDELLIEISGCLRLFGGLKPLCRQVVADIDAQGFSACLSLAPTPLAAQWLARAGQSSACLRANDLQTALAPLDVDVLRLTQADANTLAALGVRTLGDLFDLPRAGLARRFGPLMAQQLAQALGDAPDLRPSFVFPECFAQKLELPAKVDHASMLLFAARRMLASLAGWLSGRAAGVTECVFELVHEYIPPTRLVLSFADVTADLARMERVLRERLERLRLAAAVTDLRLEANAPETLSGTSEGLFAQTAARSLAPVIERLRARLGVEAVHGLAVQADHRPECATRQVPQGQGKVAQANSPRPLWLLSTPRAVQQRDDGLYSNGRLHRLAGPERIESGWWDEGEKGRSMAGDLRRDYYVAQSERGEWVWIFRDTRGWWLHGYFA